MKWLGAILMAGGLCACGSDGNTASGKPTVPVEPVVLDATEYTYRLEQSPVALPIWTTPATRKPTTADRPPEATKNELRMSAARNEHEPLQLLIGPGSGSVSIEVAPFDDLGTKQRVGLTRVRYEGGWAEYLDPLDGEISVTDAQPQPVWLSVYVPDDAPAGDHVTTITITPTGGSAITIPVRLRVFDFALPKEIHFATQLNVSVQSLLGDGSVDEAKTLLFEHRMTPKSVTWPSGFKPSITWDNDSSPSKCEAFYDEPDEGAEYSIKHLSKRYLLGEGWNGVGFPNAMVFQFVDNDTPRPGSFCGIDRGNHYGSDAYNTEWSQFLTALDGYLGANKLAERAYYYVQNEPQDDADHALAAHLCRLTKKAAPGLRIAISEEPKKEIAEDAGGSCGYDIWIAHVRAYQQDYAHTRQRDHGEAVWLYSLDHDPDPYFNPTRVDVQGVHQRIIPWTAWSHRVRGWAYYDAGRFFDGPRPTIRAELLREGFEDYEYLWLANGSAHPKVDEDALADPTAQSVASSMTSWTRDPDALMLLRFELGRYIEGSRDSLPVLQSEAGPNPRAAYFVNFQDPAGEPNADPLIIDGDTYLKIGWSAYDAELGYGWYGEHVGEPSIALYGYDDVADYSEAQRSYLYDDWGRDSLFEFALEPGKYEVTVGVGRPAKGYPGDPHNLTLEGQKLVDDELTTDAQPTIERTTVVELVDGSLSLEVGGKSASSGDWAYTFLAFMTVLPID